VDQREVDFLIGNEIAIEVKPANRIQSKDLKALREISEEGTWRQRILVCTIERPELTDHGILVLPVEDFLNRLWAGEFA
jgi:predicted AAA+ superfamily ATPase